MVRTHRIGAVLGVAFFTLILASSPAQAADEERADCSKFDEVDKRQTFRAEPSKVEDCIRFAKDPPEKWLKDEPVKTSGSGGFSYGSIQAPESPPGARKANASVSKDVIVKTCNFPPRIKITSSGISIPPGSCYDFLNDLFKDKDGKVNSDPNPPGIPPGSCEVEVDSTGQYGEKKTISAGGAIPAPCGAMLPLTTADVVLNYKADSVASTEDGAFYISAYKKSGDRYAAVLNNVKLPTYLCDANASGNGAPMKTVDLTAPVAQMITYDPSVGEINIRLRSRASMNANFIPPYDEDEPEKYLVIPLDPSTGAPQIIPDCSDAATYFKVPTSREDILVRSSNISGCDSPAVVPTPVNKYYYECKVGTVSGTNCLDAAGQVIGPATRVDNWVLWCPPSPPTNPNGYPASANGTCDQNQGVPSSYMYCPDGGVLSGSPTKPGNECLDPVTKAVIGPATPGSTACSSTAATADLSCDTLNVYPTGAGCDGKTQFAVLNTPNLYYPVGATAKLYKMDAPRTGLIADTVDNSTVYTQSDTQFFLQPTAPALIFNEGGIVRIGNGDILIMNPSSTISAGPRSVILTGGGKLVSSGGTQKATYANGASYTIPGSGVITVEVDRSVVFPAGFIYPTMPKVGADPVSPYIRMPLDKPV